MPGPGACTPTGISDTASGKVTRLPFSSSVQAWGFVVEAPKSVFISFYCVYPYGRQFSPHAARLVFAEGSSPTTSLQEITLHPLVQRAGPWPHAPATACALHLPTSTGQSSSGAPKKQRATLVVPAAGCHPCCLPATHRRCPLQLEPGLLSIDNASCYHLGGCCNVYKQRNCLCSGKNGRCEVPWPRCRQTLTLLECHGVISLKVILNFSGF